MADFSLSALILSISRSVRETVEELESQSAGVTLEELEISLDIEADIDTESLSTAAAKDIRFEKIPGIVLRRVEASETPDRERTLKSRTSRPEARNVTLRVVIAPSLD